MDVAEAKRLKVPETETAQGDWKAAGLSIGSAGVGLFGDAGAVKAASMVYLASGTRGAAKALQEASAASKAPKEIAGRGYHIETAAPRAVKAADVTKRWEAFLGPGRIQTSIRGLERWVPIGSSPPTEHAVFGSVHTR